MSASIYIDQKLNTYHFLDDKRSIEILLKKIKQAVKMARPVKGVLTSDGTISVNTPRGRNSGFEPELIRKRETILAESLELKFIGMYGLGMGLRDISKHIKDIYDTEIRLKMRLIKSCKHKKIAGYKESGGLYKI